MIRSARRMSLDAAIRVHRKWQRDKAIDVVEPDQKADND